MAQVSKLPLGKETQTRLYKLFWQTITSLSDPIQTEEFFNDLLTPTEKIMLSKRLAIAVMLIRNHDYEAIKAYLQVSSATISSVSMWLKYSGSGYRKTVEKLLRKEKIEKVILNIESVLEAINPEKTFAKTLSKGFPKGESREPF
ncbi:hypothetical protein HYW40_03490 [Candidatus Curtissbacteria bacterium]|nr:hypothetical protein [Candidatus Curtissbacteria bacterium]